VVADGGGGVVAGSRGMSRNCSRKNSMSRLSMNSMSRLSTVAATELRRRSLRVAGECDSGGLQKLLAIGGGRHRRQGGDQRWGGQRRRRDVD
jgi:hypothetical protein